MEVTSNITAEKALRWLNQGHIPGRAAIQETVLPACPAASARQMLPDAAQPPPLPWLGLPLVTMLLRLSVLKLQLTSVRSDLVQLGVIMKIPFLSSAWFMDSPGTRPFPLPVLEVETSDCLLVVLEDHSSAPGGTNKEQCTTLPEVYLNEDWGFNCLT